MKNKSEKKGAAPQAAASSSQDNDPRPEAPAKCPFKNCPHLKEILEMFVDAEKRALAAEEKLRLLTQGIQLGQQISLGGASRGSFSLEPRSKKTSLKPGITALRVELAGNVTVKSNAKKDECVITAPEHVLEQISVRQSRNTLTIGTIGSFQCIGEIRVEITLTGCLDDIVTRSSGNLAVDRIAAEKQASVVSKGSGGVTIARAEADSLHLEITGSGNLGAMKVKCRAASAVVSGSGDIRVSGTMDEFAGIISGSGSIAASSTKKAGIEIAGSGDAAIQVSRELYGRILGSGSIRYSGAVKHPKIQILGSGEAYRG